MDATSSAPGSQAAPPEPPARDGIISARLAELLDDMLAGRAPNAGRFCGNCYHPLAETRTVCPFCGIAVSEVPTVAAVPRELIDAHRRRRGREGLVVRTFAWVGLTIGVIVALLPLIFAGVSIWTGVAFLVLMFIFYVASANIANWIGDELGYRSGQAIFKRAWDRTVAAREAAARSEAARVARAARVKSRKTTRSS